MRRSTFQWKKRFFSEKGGSNTVNEGFSKDFYRKGSSVKRIRAIHWTAGLWKLNSCCLHPLPEYQLLSKPLQTLHCRTKPNSFLCFGRFCRPCGLLLYRQGPADMGVPPCLGWERCGGASRVAHSHSPCEHCRKWRLLGWCFFLCGLPFLTESCGAQGLLNGRPKGRNRTTSAFFCRFCRSWPIVDWVWKPNTMGVAECHRNQWLF